MDPQGTYEPTERTLFDRRTEILRAAPMKRAQEYRKERAAAAAAGIKCFWCMDNYVCPVCSRGASVMAHHRQLALVDRWASPKKSHSHSYRY